MPLRPFTTGVYHFCRGDDSGHNLGLAEIGRATYCIIWRYGVPGKTLLRPL
jgi:hypothetical protein